MNALSLFSALGAEADDKALHIGFADGDGEISVRDADTLGPPSDATRRFTALLRRSAPDPEHAFYDIVCETTDPRDVMAFLFAAEQDMRVLVDGLSAVDDRFFEFDGVAIHNGFADPQYGDWVGTRITDWPHNFDGRALIVTLPTEREWAEDYLRMRDAQAEKVLAVQHVVEAPSP